MQFFRRSVPLALGACDAFICHSWHDDARAAHTALMQYCARFEAEHGRTPIVWFDGLCINTSNARAALACLPVYLAGSQRLLVLAGPTFVQRLWCIFEVRASTCRSRVLLHPLCPCAAPLLAAAAAPPAAATPLAPLLRLSLLSLLSLTGVHEYARASRQVFTFIRMSGAVERIEIAPIGDGAQFEQFACEQAKCTLAEDKARLLAAIESGFGSYAPFNVLVRRLLMSAKATTASTRIV